MDRTRDRTMFGCFSKLFLNYMLKLSNCMINYDDCYYTCLCVITVSLQEPKYRYRSNE